MRIIYTILVALLLPFLSKAINQDSLYFKLNYTKKSHYITMRDGVKLYTIVYAPKDIKHKHPILMNRTPYSIGPYDSSFKAYWNTPYIGYIKENYIIVLQDVRGRYMSEGTFMDVRPYNAHKKGKEIDEASDTYDTIEWLLTHVVGNNGKVGIFGISYPGFYATMGAVCGHPAMKAASPQAPVTDWFVGDDFHHNGAFMLADAFNFYSGFGRPRPKPTQTSTGGFSYYTKDMYKFYLETGSLSQFANLMGDSITFWKDLYAHPNYDQWWQQRNARKCVTHIPSTCATLVVGGLFDAEDCFGAWNLYSAIENKANNNNTLVMGPWSHGGWARHTGEFLGNVRFGSKTSQWYHQNIEFPFFQYHLNNKKELRKPDEATIFITGSNSWRKFNQWPAPNTKPTAFYLQANNSLSNALPSQSNTWHDYISKPSKPVPYADGVQARRTNEYMSDDQRFASKRPDVLVYKTDTLQNDVTVAGPITAAIYTAITTTDIDIVVKVIDVFPDNFTYDTAIYGKAAPYPMGGYEMLVRGEVMRGKYRNSLSKPEPFVPGQPTLVKFNLPDIAHTFKKGHRIMVQVQSSWFPLVDRNPQKFVDIYHCTAADFVDATVQIGCNSKYPSYVLLPILPQ